MPLSERSLYFLLREIGGHATAVPPRDSFGFIRMALVVMQTNQTKRSPTPLRLDFFGWRLLWFSLNERSVREFSKGPKDLFSDSTEASCFAKGNYPCHRFIQTP